MAGLPLLFIVGCERSGTSWTRSIFEAHPDAVAPPRESQAWLRVSDAATLVGLGAPWSVLLERYDDDDGRPAGLHHWIDRPALEHLVRVAARRRLPPDDVADLLAASILAHAARSHGERAGRVLVEKTPGHVFYAPRIAAALPGARFVEVLRDGRDVCVSLQHRARTRSWAPSGRREQIERWVGAIEAGRRARELPSVAPRWHVARFEQLKDDPRRAVRDLLSFAHLRQDDELVDQIVELTRFDRYTATGPDQHRRSGRVGEWRSHFSDDDVVLFRELAGAVAAAAGYAVA